ncbi:L-aspartate oxidase [Bacillus piscicola]|uniref:L-aspartate oxidase n=1 Tax=Bacillus piscicola TaxID=1632684 RepID=UPI001F091DDD|nr:L-aspartate oxidase [Bacillus piscicola]
MEESMIHTDAVIVGSGIAGMLAAIELSKKMTVTLVSKSTCGAGNSEKAQGGIAASLDKNEQQAALHVDDTLACGGGLNAPDAVEALVKEAPHVMGRLLQYGVLFDQKEDGRFHLAKEGAHSCRRIFHAGGDATGREIMKQLRLALPVQVTMLEKVTIQDAIIENDTCIGVIGTDESGSRLTIHASYTVLATGGCGQLYSVTSNAEEATGDGYAIAWRAGAELVDMEFLQFHPTMLFAAGKGAGLLSEAIRGEGGVLLDENGTPIMKGRHELGDLAPRAVVAKAVHDTRQAGKDVFLSIRAIPDFEKKFPTITKRLRENGIEVEKGLLPVRPGAHFMMGGVAADACGTTSIPGLYAIGETACTGMHGANRLASNSLLEGAASALLLANALPVPPQQRRTRQTMLKLPATVPSFRKPSLQELKTTMDQWVGIVKDREGLRRMAEWLDSYQAFIESPYDPAADKEEIELKNMLTTAFLITHAALKRTETRGAHIRSDYPGEQPDWQAHSIVWQSHSRFPVVCSRDVKSREKEEVIL